MSSALELDLLLALLDAGGSKHVLKLFNQTYKLNKHYFKLVAEAGGPFLYVQDCCSLLKKRKDNHVEIHVPFVICRDGGCKCGSFHVCTHWPSKVSSCRSCRNELTKNPDNQKLYKKFPLLRELSPALTKKILKFTKFIIRPETPILFEKCSSDLLSFPKVCQYYNNESGCLRACLFFHLCGRFVDGTCNEADCRLSHDYESAHNQHIVSTCGGIPVNQQEVRQLLQSETSITSLALHALDNGAMLHDGETEICIWNLAGGCGKGAKCSFHHLNLPFWWQFETETGKWESWDTNSILILEKAFCNPVIKTVEIKIKDVIVIIDFPTMTMMDGELQVRRMSTGPEHGSRYLGSLATRYHWHWEQVENVWHEFPSCVTQGKHMPQLELPTHVIERAFFRSDKKLHFKISDSDFVLLFGGMQMKEEGCTNVRNICRRPIHRAIQKCAALVAGSENPVHEYFTEIRDANEEEWEFVKSVLQSENIPAAISAIESNILKKQFSKRNQDKKTQYLFHPDVGSSGLAIAQHGLLTSDTPGSMKNYGTGLHLSKDETYSLHFSSKKSVLLVEAVIGSYSRGKSGDISPPVTQFGDQVDCCVNNVADPDVFVLYDVAAVIPRFLIKF